MSVVKFDKNRRRQRTATKRTSIDVRKVLVIAGLAVALLSATVWLIRDTKELVSTPEPAEGSLIVNINTASEEELESVPGVGPARAAQIIAGRPYESVDELQKIAGISGKTFDSLLPFVTVKDETQPRE